MWEYFRVCFRASLNRRRRRRARHPLLAPHSPALAPPPRPGRSLVARVGPWALVARVGPWALVACALLLFCAGAASKGKPY